MQPILPFWFKQRQCKAEPADRDTVLRVSGPNLGEAFLQVEQAENKCWRASLRRAADGPEVSGTEAKFDSPKEAWEAAFELYRTQVIV